jgi:hypothetical protein
MKDKEMIYKSPHLKEHQFPDALQVAERYEDNGLFSAYQNSVLTECKAQHRALAAVMRANPRQYVWTITQCGSREAIQANPAKYAFWSGIPTACETCGAIERHIHSARPLGNYDAHPSDVPFYVPFDEPRLLVCGECADALTRTPGAHCVREKIMGRLYAWEAAGWTQQGRASYCAERQGCRLVVYLREGWKFLVIRGEHKLFCDAVFKDHFLASQAAHKMAGWPPLNTFGMTGYDFS